MFSRKKLSCVALTFLIDLKEMFQAYWKGYIVLNYLFTQYCSALVLLILVISAPQSHWNWLTSINANLVRHIDLELKTHLLPTFCFLCLLDLFIPLLPSLFPSLPLLVAPPTHTPHKNYGVLALTIIKSIVSQHPVILINKVIWTPFHFPMTLALLPLEEPPAQSYKRNIINMC